MIELILILGSAFFGLFSLFLIMTVPPTNKGLILLFTFVTFPTGLFSWLTI